LSYCNAKQDMAVMQEVQCRLAAEQWSPRLKAA
jgi:hypothetical protein